MGFALGAALPEDFQPPFVGARKGNSQALWEEVIAGITRRDLHLVGFGAQADDIMGENNFSFGHTK